MMIEYLETLLRAMRPAFTRRATFVWFVVVFAGFVARHDTYGVTSIVRALALEPEVIVLDEHPVTVKSDGASRPGALDQLSVPDGSLE